MKTRQLTLTALLLALCIASQFLKNTSVYLTGPVINCILILAAVFCGLWSAVSLSLITPLTSWLITGSPLMSAIPLIVPCVMAGNVIFAAAMWFCIRKCLCTRSLLLGTLLGAAAKAAFMGGTISLLLLPLLGSATGLPAPALAAARVTFSLTQLITALLSGVLAVLIVPTLKRTSET